MCEGRGYTDYVYKHPSIKSIEQSEIPAEGFES